MLVYGSVSALAGAVVQYWFGSSKGSSDKDKAISCLLYTSDAADERSSVDLGGRRIIKKKNHEKMFEKINC